MPDTVTVTCTADGCDNAGHAITVNVPTTDELMGGTWGGVQCGVCLATLYTPDQGES